MTGDGRRNPRGVDEGRQGQCPPLYDISFLFFTFIHATSSSKVLRDERGHARDRWGHEMEPLKASSQALRDLTSEFSQSHRYSKQFDRCDESLL